jgi:quercetin dioxygenase-like cupin family protein
MKAIRITAQPDGTYQISPLALPFIRRSGSADAEGYRKQARGEAPRTNFNPNAADALRAITLAEGRFTGLATQEGALLTFVIAGEPTLRVGNEQHALEPGDIVLTDAQSAPSITLDVRDEARLVQIVVDPGWPGADAELPDEGTIVARAQSGAKLKRIYKGDDDKAYYSDFTELFAGPSGRWSDPKPIVGFRILRWEDGEMEWHPCVTNQLGIVSSGELEYEVGGGGGAAEIFHAGDVCIAEDKTGEGHFNRARGVCYVTIMVIDTANLWPWEHGDAQLARA